MQQSALLTWSEGRNWKYIARCDVIATRVYVDATAYFIVFEIFHYNSFFVRSIIFYTVRLKTGFFARLWFDKNFNV